MDFAMSSGPGKVLEKTLKDLEIRAKVEATMQSMLIDVEVAASLQQQISTELQLSNLHQKVSEYEVALQEAQAVHSHQRREQSSLADSLVEQLWKLSQELGQLRRWKETHETTVTEHDEVVAKLLQAEEQIRVLEARPPASSIENGDADFAWQEYVSEHSTVAMLPESSTVPETSTATIENISKPQSTSERSSAATSLQQCDAKENYVAADDSDSIVKQVDALLAIDETNEKNTKDEDIPQGQAAGQHSVVGATSAAGPAVEQSDDNAVVALLQDEEEYETPTLDTLNTKVLTQIFEYLDAVEILNTAQINITMFSRVDALFGFSGVDTEENAGAPAATAEAPVPSKDISTTAPSPTSQPSPRHVLDRVPLASPIETTDVKMPSQPTTTTTAIPPRRGGIFSLLQARGSNDTVARRSTADTMDAPLSVATTDSMVSKLNDKELRAIFSLTDKLHQREKAVATLTAEKEELLGKLKGINDLKEFLIDKVRNVEESLRKSKEDEMKVAQQISSDQEVIAFLDGRVQELERDIKSLSDEKKTIAEEMSRLQMQNDRKIEVLGDMLQFERERVSENEREWKATKKLLVKEIKSCRAQLLALQAERDGLREQNERLKKAVLMTNPNGGSM